MGLHHKEWLIPMFILLVAIISTVILTQNLISSGQIDSWLVRAQAAGNPAQVAEYLGNYKGALYQADKVEGKYVSVFKYAGSYMPTYIRTLDGLIERANALTNQSPTDTSYQMGLVNLETDLSDVQSAAFGVWTACEGGIVFLLLTIVCWIIGIIGLIICAGI